MSSIQHKLGGSASVARALAEIGVMISPQAISQWRRVPAERVLDVERATGISRHELRPDIYPRDEFATPATGAA